MPVHYRSLLWLTSAFTGAVLLVQTVLDLFPPQRTAHAREDMVPRAAKILNATPSRAPATSFGPTESPLPHPHQIDTPTRTPTPITVGNFVWDDLDKDGRQDAGEPGLSGVTVQLWNDAKTQLIASTVSGANGAYTLVAPTPGSYRVRAILPAANDTFSPKDAASGDDTFDSDINPDGVNKGFTDVYVFPANLISITTIDIGIIKYRLPTATRTPTPIQVGNFVWFDVNANGLQDVSEPGLNNITVQLWNSDKTQLIDSTATAANGAYTLVAPLPGQYRVRVLPPLGALFSPKDQGANDQIDSDINPTGVDGGFTDVYTFPANLISITTIDAGLINVPATATPSNTSTATTTPTFTMTPTTTPEGTLEAVLEEHIYLPFVQR